MELQLNFQNTVEKCRIVNQSPKTGGDAHFYNEILHISLDFLQKIWKYQKSKQKNRLDGLIQKVSNY